MNFASWCETVPAEITNDRVWHVRAYQLALFAADIAWADVTKLMGDPRTRSLSDQLYRAVGSVSANVGEGYSRRSGRDRARFYEYALGSAREARDWYYKARHVLDPAVVDHRLRLYAQIIRLLLTMIPRQRRVQLSEGQPSDLGSASVRTKTRGTVGDRPEQSRVQAPGTVGDRPEQSVSLQLKDQRVSYIAQPFDPLENAPLS